jgi:hypothetical protein
MVLRSTLGLKAAVAFHGPRLGLFLLQNAILVGVVLGNQRLGCGETRIWVIGLVGLIGSIGPVINPICEPWCWYIKTYMTGS